MRKYFIAPLLLLLSVLLFPSCSSDEDSVNYEQVAKHTVLMYLNGDNSLSASLETNLKDAEVALRDSALLGSINLVIFKDNYKAYPNTRALPQLIWLHRNAKNSLDTVPLLTFDAEVNAMSQETLTKVIQATFSRFDTPIKGLIFGGHALGWAPSSNYKASAPQRQAPSYIGVDEDDGSGKTNYMEVWEFREALETAGVKFDYLLFDACNMGSLEVAYELRNLVHYMIAAPTEIEGNGFPYRRVITCLSQCQTTDGLPTALDQCAQYYFNTYRNGNGATISLFDLTQVEPLAQLCASFVNGSTIQSIYAQETDISSSQLQRWLSSFQHYGRSAVGSLYYFYDVFNHFDLLLGHETGDLQTDLDKVVLSHYYTSNYHEISINTCCGMSMAIIPAFYMGTFETKMSAYRQLQYGKLIDQ